MSLQRLLGRTSTWDQGDELLAQEEAAEGNNKRQPVVVDVNPGVDREREVVENKGYQQQQQEEDAREPADSPTQHRELRQRHGAAARRHDAPVDRRDAGELRR